MNEHDLKCFRIERDARFVLTATLDVPGRPVNVFDERVITELAWLIDMLEHDRDTRLVVFTSGKESGFLAGADVKQLQSLRTPDEAATISEVGQLLFDRVESLPMPSLAVIQGPCLGGGLEFAMACTHRIACDNAHTRIGLPEIELGILPGWGGTQRLPKLVGLTQGVRMILEATKVNARKAAEIGLVDRAASPDDFAVAVEMLIADILKGTPRRRPGNGLAAWIQDHTGLGQWLVLRAVRRKLVSRGRNYPALGAALRAIEVGIKAGHAAGLAEERRAISELLFTPTCRSLIELFFQRERARSTSSWIRSVASPVATDSRPIRKLGVVGAGVMGSGIAQLAANQGFDVVLRDVDQKFVDAGMTRIRGVLDDLVKRGSLTRIEADARFAAVMPTGESLPLAGCDLVVEAVTEREDVKLAVFRELDTRLPAGAIIASNTSALPIQHLADATHRPDRVGGLHFFNPVHRMQLVEVVRAKSTSDATIHTLVNLVKRLGKTPVVVADSPGFLVNRVLFPYLDEGVRMVCEGIPVEQIDSEAKRFGMPMGPFELLDEIGLNVAADVATTLSRLCLDPTPTPELLAMMVQRGWRGKKSGRGFYVWKHGQRVKANSSPLPPGDGSRVRAVVGAPPHSTPPHPSPLPKEEGAGKLSVIQQRLIYQLVNECSRCLGEGVVAEAWMVDLGLVLGTGFAPFTGGPLRYADAIGLPALARDLDALRQQFGERFSASSLLHRLAVEGKSFHGTANNPNDLSSQNEQSQRGEMR
jgi:3-hydroxyacyl-CoA dehydrogenase/enoyl-CoA hydratase/3-hydroxybutyryl-CoA epimerase